MWNLPPINNNSTGLCAGKTSVANYLIEQHGFTPLTIDRPTTDPGEVWSATESSPPRNPVTDCSSSTHRAFPDAEALRDYVTRDWTTHYVTTSIRSQHTLDILASRPFFLLVSVDAPVSTRWSRFHTRHLLSSPSSSQDHSPPPTLEQFIIRDDKHMYDASHGLSTLSSQARVKLVNATSSLASLAAQLARLNLTDEDRVRPSWDHYFMTLAALAARRSNCMRRAVGCVLVRGRRVISTGYNGTPRNITNCNRGGCPRCNGSGAGGSALSTCLCVHAEENALLEAGRERVAEDATLYCTTCPCLTCCIKIVQVGIREVVFNRSYYMDAEIAEIFQEAGVSLRQYSLPAEGLIHMTDPPPPQQQQPDRPSNGHKSHQEESN